MLSAFLGGVGGLLGMIVFHHKTRKWKFRILVPLFGILQLLVTGFLLWASDIYPADQTALSALESDETVTVKTTATGWLFDGPSEDTALIFYPGARVDETAYAPMLHALAGGGMDVYLVNMPLHLAFFGMNRAEGIMETASYAHYYIGGHSLGGAMAANFAAGHHMDGIILFAAYPSKEVDTDVLLLYGSEDTVVNRQRIAEAEGFVLGNYTEYVIEGGNHAQFGNYGPQEGDGTAVISAERQQALAVEKIEEMLGQ